MLVGTKVGLIQVVVPIPPNLTDEAEIVRELKRGFTCSLTLGEWQPIITTLVMDRTAVEQQLRGEGPQIVK